jgi:hypothetical protein
MATSVRHGARFGAFLTGALVVITMTIAHGEEGTRWGFGTDVGLTAGTVNDTVVTLGFNADYYLDRAFSFGPMVLLSPISDLTQIAIAGVARYHLRAGSMAFVPFAGLGLVHADLDRGSGPGQIDRNDTSWYIPLGISAEFPINPSLAFATSLIVNFHDIKLDPSVERDHASVSLPFGIRFGP